jgi:hypothetical protein
MSRGAEPVRIRRALAKAVAESGAVSVVDAAIPKKRSRPRFLAAWGPDQRTLFGKSTPLLPTLSNEPSRYKWIRSAHFYEGFPELVG